MRFLSLFSGIEAASVAWEPLGWECVGVAEIEPFPCAVLSHHYPAVPNLGSVTDITEEDIKNLGQIDLVVGGFPCQDLSVAGKRKGLRNDDGTTTRSGLFFDAMRIVQWAREHGGCRFLLVENVPGLFSSNQGRDFAEVVGEMAGCRYDVPDNGWQNTGVCLGSEGMVEWCVLDAQWFGVAQRRRRVFALADFGEWADRPPLLFERHSLSGDSAPSRQAGERVAEGATESTKKCGWLDQELTGALTAGFGKVGAPEIDAYTAIPWPAEVASTLNAAFGDKQGLEDQHVNGSCPLFVNAAQVRRLTPVECERLQGFHDNYTRIPWRNKTPENCPDGPRYKALGNSMCTNVMAWIGERIQKFT